MIPTLLFQTIFYINYKVYNKKVHKQCNFIISTHKSQLYFLLPELYIFYSPCYIYPMKKIIIALLKPFSFLPAILIMCAIYYLSSQSGEVSGSISYEISYQIIETKNEILAQGYSYDQIAYEANLIHPYVRKAAHMIEYFILAIAVSFPFYVYKIRGIWLILLAGIICVGYAGFDEYHQSLVAGRGPSPRDVIIDSVGAGIGILLVQAFCWSTLHNPDKKKRRRKRK